MFTSFKRVIKAGWVNFVRHGGLSIATIFIMVMTLSLITSLFLLAGAVQFVIADVQSKMDVSVYFKKEAPESDILKVRDEISQISGVEKVEYISEQEALDNFSQKHQDDSLIMDSLNELGINPLLASLSVRTNEVAKYDEVVAFLDNSTSNTIIEKIDYHQRKPIIERVTETTSNIKNGGIIIAIILALISGLVAFNTIRLAIFNLKEEIGIMRLVGASSWFVRGPFLIQGFIVGFLSSLITFLMTFIFCYLFAPQLNSILPGFNILYYFISNLFIIALSQIGIGIGVGIISSFVAIRRHLNV